MKYRPRQKSEIFSDLKLLNIQKSPNYNDTESSSPLYDPETYDSDVEKNSKRGKNFHQKDDTLDGILGLASLISEQEKENNMKAPADWLQQYPISLNYNWNILPTGLILESNQLVKDSFDIYFNYRDNRYYLD